MIAARIPKVADQVVNALSQTEAPARGSLAELATSAASLDREGFVSRPSWAALKEGARPPPPVSKELGEWQHGWQYYASSASDNHFRKTVILANDGTDDQAH